MYVFTDKVISMVIGAPGSGKSTLAARIVKEATKKGVVAYCNYPVLGANSVNMDMVIGQDLGESVLIIDEAGLNYNSRNTKAFGPKHYHWFATTRHRGTQIIILVQHWTRVDIVLRELATEVIKVSKWPLGFSSCGHYQADIQLITNAEGYAREFSEVFKRVGLTIYWRPSYYHMFDSYVKDQVYDVIVPVPYPLSMFPPKAPLWRRVFEVLPLIGRLLPAAAPAAPAMPAQGEHEQLPPGADLQDSGCDLQETGPLRA